MATGSQDVANQSTELLDYNLFISQPALMDATPKGTHERLAALGQRLGSAEMFQLVDAANRNPPVLKLFDRFGRRCDEV